MWLIYDDRQHPSSYNLRAKVCYRTFIKVKNPILFNVIKETKINTLNWRRCVIVILYFHVKLLILIAWETFYKNQYDPLNHETTPKLVIEHDNGWYLLTKGDIPRNIECAEFMPVQFTINSLHERLNIRSTKNKTHKFTWPELFWNKT